jgi:hypothetical protein
MMLSRGKQDEMSFALKDRRKNDERGTEGTKSQRDAGRARPKREMNQNKSDRIKTKGGMTVDGLKSERPPDRTPKGKEANCI